MTTHILLVEDEVKRRGLRITRLNLQVLDPDYQQRQQALYVVP